jgi:hypothetical protein
VCNGGHEAWAENRKTKREKAHITYHYCPQAQSIFVGLQKHKSFPTSTIQGLFYLLNLITSCSKKLSTSFIPKNNVLGFLGQIGANKNYSCITIY